MILDTIIVRMSGTVFGNYYSYGSLAILNKWQQKESTWAGLENKHRPDIRVRMIPGSRDITPILGAYEVYPDIDPDIVPVGDNRIISSPPKSEVLSYREYDT